VLDALVSAGATDLAGPSFSIENDEAAKDEARKRALERAQKRASAYAEMLGYDDVRVLEINESIRGSGPVQQVAMRSAAIEVAAAEAPPVQPGMVSTGVSITIKFEMVEDEDEEASKA
ncbi:MAG: SIMPL domain-containing protein, partial [Pseudomonadota bacterium]